MAGRFLAVRGGRADRLLHPDQGHRRADLRRGAAGSREDQGQLAVGLRGAQALPAWGFHRDGPPLRREHHVLPGGHVLHHLSEGPGGRGHQLDPLVPARGARRPLRDDSPRRAAVRPHRAAPGVPGRCGSRRDLGLLRIPDDKQRQLRGDHRGRDAGPDDPRDHVLTTAGDHGRDVPDQDALFRCVPWLPGHIDRGGLARADHRGQAARRLRVVGPGGSVSGRRVRRVLRGSPDLPRDQGHRPQVAGRGRRRRARRRTPGGRRMTELAGRSALVTGGASGIGAACAREFAARGATVTVADVDEVAAKSLASEIGGSAWNIDLLDVGSLEELALETDVLVNNAGIQSIDPIVEFRPERFRAMMALMVEAPFLLIRAALPHMYEQGFGRIINVSSVHGLRASEFKVAYVTAKHALEGLSKVTALEGGAHGVTSNCVNPGYVRTPLVTKQIADQARTHGIPEQEVVETILLSESAIKRLVEPEEVASLAGWLASADAGMVTGASYTMDGGWSAR